MKVALRPRTPNWSRADRLSGVTGLSRFCLPCPVADTITRRESNRTSKIDRDLSDLEE
jgi:hypothetical protein